MKKKLSLITVAIVIAIIFIIIICSILNNDKENLDISISKDNITVFPEFIEKNEEDIEKENYMGKEDSLSDFLNVSLGTGAEIFGIIGTEVEIPIIMDALPEGDYKRISIDISIPEYFFVENVKFNTENIKGNAAYEYSEDLLLIFVEGDLIEYKNVNSSIFAEITLKAKKNVTTTTVLTLELNNLIIDGGNVVYNDNDVNTKVRLNYMETGALAKIPGFSNPLISHKFGADPYALVYDGRVYIYLTSDAYEYDSNGNVIDNTYGKINTITVISSNDLINWTDHGEIPVAGPNGAAKWAAHSWAPAVAVKKIDGKDKFFLYFANDASNIGVLTADSPIGPFTDPLGQSLINRDVPGVRNVTWCFDPAVLVDDDQKAYLYFGGGLPSNTQEDALHPKTGRVIQLGDDMISTVGSAVLIDAPALFEDSGINKYNGKYYYSYCSNFSGTHLDGYPPHGEIAYMVSDSPMGPFTYVGSILKNPAEFFAVGGNNHHCMFEFSGNWYIAYHAQTLGKATKITKGYRSPHINRFEFNSEGYIIPIKADMIGERLYLDVNPYVRNEAETFAWNAGISTAKCTEPGGYIKEVNNKLTDIHNSSWTALSGVEFGVNGAESFLANISSFNGGEIEIRIDSILGEVIGNLNIVPSGKDGEWKLYECSINKVTGKHDVFFVYKGEDSINLFEIDYWMFIEENSK